MKLLFLAPQPFFQERGTPIAVRLALEVLAERNRGGAQPGDRIDLLTYHEGMDVDIPGVKIHRIKPPGFIRDVPPGVSIRKIFCDLYFFFAALKLVLLNRNNQYDFVHAVEESVFFALLFKIFFRIPYIYDMDSSLSLQLTDKWRVLKPLMPLLEICEHLVVRNSDAVAPVCDALAAIAKGHGAARTFLVRDVSLLDVADTKHSAPALRAEISAAPDDVLIMYVGNLEYYQGIDLLIRSFAAISSTHQTSKLVIVGGNAGDIEFYRQLGAELGIEARVHFLGPKPLAHLRDLLLQADVLVSPRVKGNNTPMKIYSYLHSGRAILATDLPTHSQVLDTSMAYLSSPNTDSFSAGLLTLLKEPGLREQLGSTAKKYAERHYVFEVFKTSLNDLYDNLSHSVAPHIAVVKQS